MARATYETDIVVIGGGAAGLAAAIGAARKGARVILLEKSSAPGGKASQAVVGTICGAHYRSENPESRYISTTAFSTEFCEAVRLYSKTEAVSHYQGNLHFLPYSPFGFILASEKLLSHEPLIEVYYHAILQDVKLVDQKITEISVLNYNRQEVIKASKIIDCSGESIVSQLADLPLYREKEYQASAIVFSLENIIPDDAVKLSLAVLRAISKAMGDKELPLHMGRVSIVPGSIKGSSILFKVGLDIVVNNQPFNKSELEKQGRQAVQAVSEVLIARVSHFKNAHIGYVAPETGVRTGPLSKGEYQLTRSDVLSCARFDDGIAKGSWPIEMWRPGKPVELEFFDHDNYYEIPLRSLKSDRVENLYFAGRIISATPEAAASSRVIGTCLGTGYAAGAAAALSLQGLDSHQIIKDIRKDQVEN